MKARVLIVDDEDAVRSSLKMIFEYEGYEVLLAANGPVGLKLAEQEAPDLVFLDIKMPQMDGLEVLKRLKERDGAPPVVILSGHGTVKTAVEAVKLGAFDFIEKPPESERILIAARNALGQQRLVEENRRLRLVFDDRYRMVGRSAALEKVWEAVRRAAPTNATVLITGESGVGKELVARAIHRNSNRERRGVRPGELRRDPRGADRERAVRPREGLVHRRDREADRQVRAGPQGHDLPRRGRRHEPAHPGQGAAGAAGGRGRADRLAEDDPGRRAGHRRHQQGPRGGDREGALPRGPLLPPLRDPGPRAAAARAAGGRPAARRALRRASSAPRTTSGPGASPRRRSRPSAATPGAATSAS